MRQSTPQLMVFDKSSSSQLENEYSKQLKLIRDNILRSIPLQLRTASTECNGPTHSDLDLDKATDFIESHAKKKLWKHEVAKFVVLKESSPKLLATVPGKCVVRLFNDYDLLEEMILADGPSDGNWPHAMTIFSEILQESDAVHDKDYPVLHRLAIAISLVHATPIPQTNPEETTEENDLIPETHVDPVRRYLNYEVAYLEGELDPSFDTLSTWELRFVVDGDEPDEVAAWGRKTLRNFYPEHAINANQNPDWLYAALVRSDIPYGSSRVGEDDPKLHKYQNILRNGGICGRRAFFGRFILRAFGIPTTARPSKGHAALVHWSGSNRDWVVNLGGGWGKGWTETPYVKDLDFLATTQARRKEKYPHVKLAQLIGKFFDEKPLFGIYDEKERGRDQGVILNLQRKDVVGFWYRLSLRYQSLILKHPSSLNPFEHKQLTLPNVLHEARGQKAEVRGCYQFKDSYGRIVICIPAASFFDPAKTKDVRIMKGFGTNERGGNQQIYLPSFQPQGTTILRGGSWKDDHTWLCTSGARLLSGGYGRYENWGFRVAMPSGDEGFARPKLNLMVSLQNGIGIEFVYIPPGQFVMGGSSTKDGRFNCVELPHHQVKISKGFYLGKYPVTQAQYQAVMKGKNPSKSSKGPGYPVDNISIEDATAFCNHATEMTGNYIRLPTEAEWEYAARGDPKSDSADSKWFFGNDHSNLEDYAWIKDNAEGKSHPVGLKKPNPFGLHDIYGNVCERVSDTYRKDYYSENNKLGLVVDPTGPSQGVKSKFQYYVKNVPLSGDYSLLAKVCTVTAHQRLNVSTKSNGANASVLNLPYTIGEWVESDPVVLALEKGENFLYFWRDSPPQYGVSIKEFTLSKIE